MLIEFSVGNFRSFHAPVTLSMQAAKLRSRNMRLDDLNVFQADRLSLLRSAAIYGANASGKSNLIQAMAFMRRFVLQSSRESQAGEPTGVERFRLSTTTQDEPACFQIIFRLNDRRYRYGFEIDEEQVRAEWLYHTGRYETRLFIREGAQYDISSVFKPGRGLTERTRDNALFLSVAAQFNVRLAVPLLEWFRKGFNIISGLDDTTYAGFTLRRFDTDESFRQRVLAFVREADLGIADIHVEKLPLAEAPIPKEVQNLLTQLTKEQSRSGEKILVNRLKTTHQVFDLELNAVGWETFDMEGQESQGTQKIFILSGPLLETLEEGKVLIIDEMEARLHSSITRAVIQLFNSPQTNPRNAQLVFATHDTSLLSHRFFRRDQIWFTEKDQYGATDMYSLAELKVRNDASFDKDYIAGKYGAIPFIGELHSLFEEHPDGQKA